DLTLSEAFDNNLALEDYWADANVGAVDPVGNINYWPLNQMGMDDENGKKVGAYNFRGAILNMGTNDQNDQKMNIQIMRNGAEILNQNSETKALWSLERDTLTLAEPWLADDYGVYDFNYTVLGDVPDELPINNTAKLSFTVNDTLYHRADFTTEATSGGGGWVGGNNAGDMVGVGYDLKAPAEINSIYARLGGITAGANTTTQFVLVKDMGLDGYIEYIMSDVVEAQNLGSSWQTLQMVKDGETEFLEPGFYIACVRMWGEAAGDADGINGMSVGWDTDTKWTGQYSFLWRAVAATWWSIDKLNQIGIVLNTPAATSTAGLTFNVDLSKQTASGEFKPGVDLVDVVGLDPTWEGTLALTDTDGDGIYTGSIENLTVAKYMKYSYRINGVREGEPKFGYLTRTWRISYWNKLADTYNTNSPLFIFNVDMSKQIANGNFQPGIDTLEVKGLSGTWWRSMTLKDDDNDGIYSAKLTSTLYYGTEIQYKYRINGKFESYPLTGDPYRKHTVKYWNYLGDVYNEGGSSINTTDLADSFSVYPNPAQGAFKVAITRGVATDLLITLTNMQGQVVYQNKVANTTNHLETIDTKMSKGVYFLTVNTGREVKVQKVVIQ
ncbi:MAG: T9SS type A sorting domain-containing protein, partial [Bacteroidia bacterium]|nr:T9SS type A sorting domain-containing protein [Bacteroidia bacterium]